jgi:succinate dehydrogenase (or fumarate reductase) cytochrome b subunit, b558 family
MALTGIILFGWITAHMLGNLKLYLGSEALNHYAEWLRAMGYPLLPHTAALWISRIVLVVCGWLHIQAATQLTLMNWEARPVGYERKETVVAGYASRTMRWSGVLLALFVVFHLMHLTWGNLHPGAPFKVGEVYYNVVTGFQVVWVSIFYIVANILLGFHLFHGLWSMFQSMGWNNPKFNPWRRWFATAFAWIITLGNISLPLAVLTGVVRL